MGDYVKLASYEVTAGGGDTTITLASISGAHQHLTLRHRLRATGSNAYQQLKVRLNGDTAANYDWVLDDSGGVATGTGVTFMLLGYIAGGSVTAHFTKVGQLELPYYSDTAWNKYVRDVGIQLGGLFRRDSSGGGWRSQAAITQIDLFLDANNFAAGSRVDLYGIN